MSSYYVPGTISNTEDILTKHTKTIASMELTVDKMSRQIYMMLEGVSTSEVGYRKFLGLQS